MAQEMQEKEEQMQEASKKLEINDRRKNVWTMHKMGISHEKIAERLGVSVKTISRDYQELKSEAIEWMASLPEGEIQLYHKKGIENIEMILKELWRIFNTTKDESVRVRILTLIADKTKMLSEMQGGKKILEVRKDVLSQLYDKKCRGGKYLHQM